MSNATNNNTLQTNSPVYGAPVRKLYSSIDTYSAVVADLTPASAATDIVTISGFASKIILITYLEISISASATGLIDLYAYKRTTANAGGTSAIVSSIAHDSTSPAASASVKSYTANPTSLGAGVLVRGAHYALPSTSPNGYPISLFCQRFGDASAKPIVLRGTAESLAINLNGQTISSGNVYVNIEWTEM